MLSTYIWAINMVKKNIYILYQNIIINIILVS